MATLLHQQDNTLELKNHAPTREIVVKPMEGFKTLDSAGVVDTRLWKGGNAIYAVMGDGGIWHFQYQNGVLPEVLRGKFTSLSKLVSFAKEYFSKRNLEVTEVKDLYNAA